MVEQPVFMSLGSQYSLEASLRELVPVYQASTQQLKEQLEQHFQGTAVVTYKGRDALTLLLAQLKNQHRKQVFLQGFACYALESAIISAGKKPGFVDVAADSVNLSITEIERAQKKYGLPAALIIQHTFGVPAQMTPIVQWCQKNQVALIADIAQSFGAQDEIGRELGLSADAVLCSFGRDKVVDGVSGGAAVVRNQEYFHQLSQPAASVPLFVQLTDAVYPLITWKIRKLYRFGLGKALHVLAKAMGILQSPLYSPVSQPSRLPASRAAAIIRTVARLPKLRQHRRMIAQVYMKELRHVSQIKLLVSETQIKNGANLRFPLWVPDPKALIAYLRGCDIHIADRWYRSVIDCSTLDCQSTYQAGICPQAESLAEHAIQLPTHQEISATVAKQITKQIKAFYEATI